MNYKTPGVYIEEISKLPPSIAQVETAIPAFVGYTEKAKRKVDNDIQLKPIRITSMLEYRNFYGTAPEFNDFNVVLDETTVNGVTTRSVVVNKTGDQIFNMYHSLEMYFANGGGPCYIVSVGNFTSASISKTALSNGLLEVEQKDEPTLIVFPDATSLDSTDYYTLLQEALAQCNKLKDRFTIVDVPMGTIGINDDAQNFRDDFSSDFVNYGASYYPYLKTSLNYHYDEDAIRVASEGIGVSTALVAITSSDTTMTQLNTEISPLKTSIDTNATTIAGITSNAANKGTIFSESETVIEETNQLIGLLENVVSSSESAEDAATVAINAIDADEDTGSIVSDIQAAQSSIDHSAISSAITALNGHVSNIEAAIPDDTVAAANTVKSEVALIKTAVAAIDLSGLIAALADLKTDTTAANALDIGEPLSEFEDTDNQLYNQVKAEIQRDLRVVLPPSSTVAGIYARIDNNRGVWKAPANVSVSSVIEPAINITSEDQEGLNVDVVAGKSINAIRSFTGKGTLVWGARTLDGNSNEWRYVNVRRLFIMIEESVMKASERFVFEANTKSTWSAVSSMISNYLTNLWRQGALQGATPEDAFYVAVGLGSTMTYQDILEGNMIIEIGIAAVRPAEFIILRFSHKMVENA